MIPLVKAIIVAVIVVGVGAPTAYVAYNYSATASTVPITNFIPADSNAVIHYQNGTLSVYAYAASNNTSAVLVDYSLSSFKSFFNTTTGLGFKSNLSSSINMTPLNYSYHGFTIYKVNGISFNLNSVIGGFSAFNLSSNNSSNLTSNISKLNSSFYVSPVESNILIMGNLSSIKASINAEFYGTFLKNGLKYLSVSGTGLGFYINLTSKNLTSNSTMNLAIPPITIYGNVSATITNITFTNINQTTSSELSLTFSTILPNLSNRNITEVTTPIFTSNSASFELSVGYLTFGADIPVILLNYMSKYSSGSNPFL